MTDTIQAKRPDLTFPPETRRALKDYTSAECGGTIPSGSIYVRKISRVDGKMVGRKSHASSLGCFASTQKDNATIAFAPSVAVPFDPRKAVRSFPWPLVLLGAGIVLAAMMLASFWGHP